MRATWLTDLHLSFLDVEGMKAFASAVKREEPEVLLVTGDTGEAENVQQFLELLALIAPVHAVLGNHDYYGSSIAALRERAAPTAWWLPAHAPVRLTDATVLVGVDGWGDGRAGDLESQVKLSDWQAIRELDDLLWAPADVRCGRLRAIGEAEAAALEAQLAKVGDAREVLVLTHVPPFPDACWYDGKRSDDAWLPWFTCVAVGEVLRAYAERHPERAITVLCGHTHGRGEYRAAANLLVRTGGWPPKQKSYGNPIVQATWQLA